MTTSDNSSDHDLQARLSELDAEIERIAGDRAALTEQVGGGGVGAQDSEDTAAALTNLEESDALLRMLEQQRDEIRRRLGAS